MYGIDSRLLKIGSLARNRLFDIIRETGPVLGLEEAEDILRSPHTAAR